MGWRDPWPSWHGTRSGRRTRAWCDVRTLVYAHSMLHRVATSLALLAIACGPNVEPSGSASGSGGTGTSTTTGTTSSTSTTAGNTSTTTTTTTTTTTAGDTTTTSDGSS